MTQKKWQLCIALLAFSLLTNQIVAQENEKTETDEKPTVNQTAQSIEVGSGDKKTKLHYWLFLPKDYKADDSDKAKQWPLMIFLHGMGERGPADGSRLGVVKKWGPPKRVAKHPDFPFVLVSPQCPVTRRGWDLEHLNELTDAMIEQHQVDPNRVYLTGLSMGGYGTWMLAAKYPQKFAAAVPICGGGGAATAEKLKDLPIWAFHGDADFVVKVSQSQKMIDAIKKAGGQKAKITIYKGVGHNSWSQTYANEKVYEWLLSHKRPNNKQKN